MNTKCSFLIVFLHIFLFIGFISCNKEKTNTPFDPELFEMATETEGFTWFMNSGDLLNRSSGSGHSEPYLRTRYNSIASTQLDLDGKIQPGAVFPEGSLVVKELFSTSTTLGGYAILFKDSDNENADSRGWVWGYTDASGVVREPASEKGKSCISCHLQSENIDYMLMNKFFP